MGASREMPFRSVVVVAPVSSIGTRFKRRLGLVDWGRNRFSGTYRHSAQLLLAFVAYIAVCLLPLLRRATHCIVCGTQVTSMVVVVVRKPWRRPLIAWKGSSSHTRNRIRMLQARIQIRVQAATTATAVATATVTTNATATATATVLRGVEAC